MATALPETPALSVILPMADHRGWARQAATGWVAQTAPAHRFEIIAVSYGRSPNLDERVRKVLRPSDQMVTCRSLNEAVIYDAGAAPARGKLLLFTEAHVLPRPDVVEKVLQAFANSGYDAANLGSDHISRTPFAQLDQLLWERESKAFRGLGPWRSVGLRGFVIRTDLFRRLGPFVEEYDRFAETALAIQLHRGGHCIGEIPAAQVVHANFEKLRGISPHLRTGFQGECAFWRREPELARSYFGPIPPWSRYPAIDRDGAWLACQAIVRSWWSDRGRPGWPAKVVGTLRLLPQLAADIVLGRRGVARLAFWRAVARGIALEARLGSGRGLPRRETESLLKEYHSVREEWARCGALDYLAGQPPKPAPEVKDGLALRLAETDGQELMGFFPQEQWEGEGYHWSLPVGVIRLRIPPGDYRLRLDVHATGTLKDRCLRLFFNRHGFAPEAVREIDGCLEFEVHRDQFTSADEQRLVMTCAPFCPRRHGLPDPRDLGVALFAITVKSLAGTSQLPNWGNIRHAA